MAECAQFDAARFAVRLYCDREGATFFFSFHFSSTGKDFPLAYCYHHEAGPYLVLDQESCIEQQPSQMDPNGNGDAAGHAG